MKRIRKTTIEDLPAVMPVYAAAREFMVRTGNPDQWINGYPAESDIRRDIDASCHYVIEHDDGDIVGAFMFRIGHDATYDVIERGAWLDDEDYGVVHRLVSSGRCNGISDICFDYCFSKVKNIRVDTHKENKMMQRALMRYGFIYCGIIYCHNGTPRLAFQKSL